ncbi:MAG: tetratricopeptide (TPR) repeat protein [Verrucomicrobiales bacterium]|jgi:tetratricopeptide (TPR) repeat protein
MASTSKLMDSNEDSPPLFDWRVMASGLKRRVGKLFGRKPEPDPEKPEEPQKKPERPKPKEEPAPAAAALVQPPSTPGPAPVETKGQAVERQRRSQIFDKILGEDRELAGGTAPKPPTRPKRPTTEPPVETEPAKAKEKQAERPKKEAKSKAKAKPKQPRPKGLSATAEYSQKKSAAERSRAEGDHRSAALHYQQALDLTLKAKVDATQQTRLHIEHADVLSKLGRDEEAATALRRAEAVLPEVSGVAGHELKVSIDLQLGTQALTRGDFSESERRNINAINRYEEHCSPNDARLGRMYLDLGRVYFDAGYNDNAIEITLNALHVFESSKHDVRGDLVSVYRQLAGIAFKKGELEAAVKHLLEAYRLATDSATSSNRRVLTEIEITLATVYSHVGEYETASSWFAAAIEHQEGSKPRSKWPLSLLYTNLALVQTRGAGEPQSHCFTRSLDLQFAEMAMTRTGS